MVSGDSIQCAGATLGQHRHVCAFFNDLDEEQRALCSFFKEGIDRGEKAAHIVEADNREEYLRRLFDAGINVQEMMEIGRLEVLPWTDMYVRDHRFDQDAMLASVEALIQSGTAAGYPRTRLVGHHMDWLFCDNLAVNNFLEYEARLNHVLSKYDDPVICNYDLSKVGASVAMDIMRTHPLVIIGGLLLRENPYFVPPEQFLLDQGDDWANFNLAVLYERGNGVTQDYKEAMRLYQIAAGKGILLAAVNIGNFYNAGLGVAQDPAEAARWYREPAEHGIAVAQFDLAVLYAKGRGRTQDDERAAALYRKAAEQGFAPAQYAFGKINTEGRGVPQDDRQARAWMQKAADGGFSDAKTWLAAH
jgi:hypothetical protein